MACVVLDDESIGEQELKTEFRDKMLQVLITSDAKVVSQTSMKIT